MFVVKNIKNRRRKKITKEMYEDLLERNKLQISELNTLTEEQDRHIIDLEKENAELKNRNSELAERNREEINYGRLEKMKIKRIKNGLYRKSNFLDFVNENENAFYLVFFNLVLIALIIILLLEK